MLKKKKDKLQQNDSKEGAGAAAQSSRACPLVSPFCAVRFLVPEFAFYQTTALSSHGFKAKLL